MEARDLLTKHHIERLDSLTKGYKNGIYNGPQFSRNYVDDPEYGVPFLTTSTMQQADITNLPYISKKEASSPKLGYLEIEEGMTLITCSGSIGKMVFSRKDMSGVWSNQDIMKVVADNMKVLPGYLHAFLAGRFGVPLVISGTYGAIIQHIEPHHLADLPVPRLGAVEQQAHDLVQRAADLQVKSSATLNKAGKLTNNSCGFPAKLAQSARVFSFGIARSTDTLKRLDATFHNPAAQEADLLLKLANGVSFAEAGVSVLESNRMKQVFVDEDYGVPFITSSGIFLKNITPERNIRETLLGAEDSWRVNEKDSLIARSGQVSGIIGRGVWADARLDGFAASPHILRLRSSNPEFPAGYVFSFLCLTDVGYQLLVRTAAGSSIPFLPREDVLRIYIPTLPSLKQRNEIAQLVETAGRLRGEAQQAEFDAIALVERAIEEGGK
jgi:type I restriction enzyme S subunit